MTHREADDHSDAPDAAVGGEAWFLVRPIPVVGAAALLSRDEARHATAARRLRPGDMVTLFDGRGARALARLGAKRATDGSLAVEVVQRVDVPRPVPAIVLGTAIPKGDRWSTLLDMAAQLGASRIVPLECERSVVRSASIKRDRAERILLEACKQSRRPWCPELAGAMTPEVLVRATAGISLIAQPGGRTLSQLMAMPVAAGGAAEIALLIGPEGGFSDREVSACVAAGAHALALGEGILRVETACAAALAIIGAAPFVPRR